MPVSNGDSPYLFSPIWHILIFHPSMKASLNNFLRAGDTSTHSISHPSHPEMNKTEKLCLTLNDFGDNLKHAFETLRSDKDLSDVTLVCEDGQQLEAHRIILASCSPLFMRIFRNTKHSHPFIYMKGLWSVDLEPILDFAYCQSLCKLRTGQLTRELRTANCLLFLLYVCDLSDICLIILILSILCYFFLIIFFGCLRICVLT